MITRDQLDAAFEMMSDRLAGRGVDARLVLFGDVAMMLGHDARAHIHHVDAVATPRGPVMGVAREAGERLGLPAYWFNDQGASQLPKFLADDLVELFVKPHLEVHLLGPEVLLAMTATTPGRPGSGADIQRLARALDITSSIDVEVLIAEIYPGRTLAAAARSTLDELL